MATVYIKDGHEFKSEWALRRAFPDQIFPKLTDEVMTMVGITKEEREDVKTDEQLVVKTDEQLVAEVRRQRDALLRESDFYVMPDYPATEDGLVAVKAYRQALRDIPEQSGFPRNVQWPSLPSALSREKGLATVGLAVLGI